MLSYSRKGSFSFEASDWLARAGECASVLGSVSLKNGYLLYIKATLFNNFCGTVIVGT